jgi:hypothetical protein
MRASNYLLSPLVDGDVDGDVVDGEVEVDGDVLDEDFFFELSVASLLPVELGESVRPVGCRLGSLDFVLDAVEDMSSTVSWSFNTEILASPTPVTFATSSTDLKGRAATMAEATSGVIPGRRCNVAASAVFTLILSGEPPLLLLLLAGEVSVAVVSAACKNGRASDRAAAPIIGRNNFFIRGLRTLTRRLGEVGVPRGFFPDIPPPAANLASADVHRGKMEFGIGPQP